MKKIYRIFIVWVIIASSIGYVFAEGFPTTEVEYHNAVGGDDIRMYDGVGNVTTVALDNTAPVVHGITYSGDNYVMDIEDTESGIWKIEDDNGSYVIDTVGSCISDNESYVMAPVTTRTTVTRPMEGVAYITVYDHANNSVEVTLEKTPPVVESITYDGDYYIIQVSDTDSGVWKVEDNNGLLTKVSDGVYKGRMVEGNESKGVTWVSAYDKANNMTTVELEKTPPAIDRITHSGEYYNVYVSDPGEQDGRGSGIWKVEDNKGLLTKISDGVYRGRMMNGDVYVGVTEVTVYDRANNKTTWQVYTQRVDGSMKLYDQVGNQITVPIDYTAPVVESITYSGDNYILQVSDTESGVWKVVDDNGYEEFKRGTQIATVTRAMEGVAYITIYDHVNNSVEVTLEKTPPVVESLTYSGDYYIIQVSDTDSGIWKVEDNNGLLEEVSDGVYRGRMVDGDTSMGVEWITAYDKANNMTTVELEKTPPVIDNITHSGKCYRVYVSDPGENNGTGSGIWRMEDNNGPLAKVSDGVYEGRRMIGNQYVEVSDITVYDRANNKTTWHAYTQRLEGRESMILYDEVGNTTIIQLDHTAPVVHGVAYSDGSYTIDIEDTESGIWKVVDNNGYELLELGTTRASVTREMENVSEIIVYDNANNSVEVLTDAPIVVSLEKVASNRNIRMRVIDSEVDLYKVALTPYIRSQAIALLRGRDDTVEFTLPHDGIQKIYVLNQAGNYVEMNLEDYQDVSEYVAQTVEDARCEISSDTTISVSEPSGIKITGTCTLTIDNTNDIIIGSTLSVHPGIEISAGVAATINVVGEGVVSVYGGYDVDEYGSSIHYAGIHVPEGSSLRITGEGEIRSYGNSNGGYGTGAGIGGNGVCVTDLRTSASRSNAGSVNISGAKVLAQGGHDSAKVYGSGAGIGGGGIHNTVATTIEGGNISSCRISSGRVEAIGGYAMNEAKGCGAGIGGGGIHNTIGATTTGGSMSVVNITGGMTRCYGGCAESTYGGGAGIGGGGVATNVESSIVAGEVTTVSIEEGTVIATKGHRVNTFGLGEDVGDGGVYNNGGEEYRKTCTVARAYKMGTNAVIEAKDVGNGLTKITESVKGSAIATFSKNNEVLRFMLSNANVDYVYVHDNYGNYEKVILEEDDTKPKMKRRRNGEEFVLELQDTESGLCKLTDETGGIIRDYSEYNYPRELQRYPISSAYDTIRIYNAVGNYEEMTLSQDHDDPVVGNIINVGYGKIELTLMDDSGVATMAMYKGESEDPEDVMEFSDNPQECIVKIPDDITKVVVTDIFENEAIVEIGDVAQMRDVYRMKGDDIKLNIADVVRIYYVKSNVEYELLDNPNDGTYIVNIPSDVNVMHVIDRDGQDVSIYMDRIATRVSKAMLGSDEIRMLANITSSEAIKKVVYLDEGSEQTGVLTMDDDTYEMSGVREIPDDTVAFMLVYDDDICKVVLDKDSSIPQSSSVYITGEGNVAVTLEDPAGVSRVQYYDGAGVEHHIDIADGPEVKALEMDANIRKILVYDVFGDVRAVELDPTLQVSVSRMKGNKARVNIISEKEIRKIRYMNGRGEVETIALQEGATQYDGVISNLGEDKITVVYENELRDEVTLKPDMPSEVKSAYIEGDGVVVDIVDATGVSEVVYGVGTNDKVVFDDPLINATARVPANTTSISVKDALGNVETIGLAGLMKIDNMYVREGLVLIDVENIARVYYVNAQGEEVEVSIVGGNIKIGQDICKLHLVDNANKDIEVVVPQVGVTIGRATTDGAKAVLDVGGSKEVSRIEVRDVDGERLESSIANGVIIAEGGSIADAVVTYEDGSSNRIPLQQKTQTRVGNMYQSGVDESINITVYSNAGIDYVDYYLLGDKYSIRVGNLVEAQIRVPKGTTKIIVVDGLGGEYEVDISGGVPRIANVHRNENGDIVVDTNMERLYYVDEKEVERTLMARNGQVLVPDGVDKIYTKDGEDKGVEVEVGSVSVMVNKATVNASGSKVSLNISTGVNKLRKIVFYDSESRVLEEREIEDASSIDQEIELMNTVHHIGVVYGDDTEVMLSLETDDAESGVYNGVMLTNGNMLVTIEDSAGVCGIVYEDEYGEGYEIECDGSTRVTQEISEDMIDVKVEDRFGNATMIDLSDIEVIGSIHNAKVSRDGNKGLVNITTSKKMERLWYVDRNGERHVMKVGENELNEVIEVNGAREIVVMYEDESITRVRLEKDDSYPEVSNVRREYMILKMTVDDALGLVKIMDDNNRILERFTKTQVHEDVTLNIAKDATSVYVYDRLGNITQVVLADYPLVDNVYKDKNGNISVVTEGIDTMYYVDEKGNEVMVERNEDGTVTVPDNVGSIYLVADEGEEIEIGVPEDKIDKAVILKDEKTASVVIDVGENRTVGSIVCYGGTGREIGRVEGENVDLRSTMDVPVGTKDVRIVYEDGTSNVVELEDWRDTECCDAYQSQEDGTKTVRVKNESGVSELQYTLGGEDYVIQLSGDREIMLDVPGDATEVKVVDRFGESKEVTGLSDLPVLKNIHENRNGDVVIDTTKTLYYGNDIEVDSDESGRKVVPAGVDKVYTKDEGEKNVTVDVGEVNIKVKSAAVKNGRVALNLDAKKSIAKVVCIGEKEEKEIEVGDSNINDVLEDVPEGTRAVRVEYAKEQEGNVSKTTEILLEDDEQNPVAYNKVMLEDGKIQVILKDLAGVREIQCGENEVIPIEGNPTYAVHEFSVPEGVDSVDVVDMFGDKTRLDITEDAMDAKVESCAKGVSGNHAMVELRAKQSKGGIASVSYVNKRGERYINVLEEGTLNYRELLDVEGADEIEVSYGDGTRSNIKLEVDEDGPTNVKAVRNGEGLYNVILEDRRGIGRLKLGEEEVEISGLPRRVIVKIDTKRYGAYSAMSDDENLRVETNGDDVIVLANPESVSDKVMIYDGVGNMSDVNTRSLDRGVEADSKGPECSIVYADSKYVLHMEDASGIENVRGKDTGVVVHRIEGLPTEWTSEASSNPEGESMLVVSDGVGNETEIPLQVDDGLGAREVWKYRRDGKIHMKVRDSVGISYVKLEFGHVLAEYEDNPLEVELEFDGMNADYVKVKDVFGHESRITLTDVTMVVNGAYRNEAGDKIAVDIVNRGMGIRKVTYDDGRVIDRDVEEGRRNIYDVEGETTRIRIYYRDDVYAEVELEEDSEGATVVRNEEGGRLYRGNGYVVIRAVDEQAGVSAIVAGESVSADGENEVIRRLVLGGANTVVVRDGLGNETSIDVGDIAEDSDAPKASIRYVREDDVYEIEMRDSDVGLWKIVKNRTEELWDYTDAMYPKEKSLTLDDMHGVKSIEVYDALGNKVEVKLDDVLCVVEYIYKNAGDDKVAVSVDDIRGIKKVAVEKNGREKVVERYKKAQDKVCKCYDVTGGVDAVRIYSGDGNVMRWSDVEIYDVPPTVDGCSVYALVGIRKLEYDDGVVVEFKQDMPTKVDVDLVHHSSVYVRDALDNGVMMR